MDGGREGGGGDRRGVSKSTVTEVAVARVVEKVVADGGMKVGIHDG